MTGWFKILDGKQAGTIFVARRFPFWVGRGAENELRLQEPGVWERHVEIGLDKAKGFTARAHGDAAARLNGESFEMGQLRNGDVLELGGVCIQFWLPPAVISSQRWRESLTWGGLVVLAGIQVWLAYRISL